MTQAISILTHACSMIFRDFIATLRILAPGLLIIAAGAVILLVFGPSLALINSDAGELPGGGAFGVLFLAVITMLIGFVVMIVLWHRYVLLDDEQRSRGLMPSIGTVLRYIGYSILIGLLASICAFVAFIPVGIVVAATGGNLVILTVLSIVAIAFSGWILMRCSLPLPAVSIGDQFGIGESWRATAPLAGTIFWLMVAVSVLNAVLGYVPGLLFSNLAILAMVADVVATLITALISASVLTTLYGHLVQGRPLSG